MSEKKQVIICTDGIFPQAVGGMQRHSRLLVEHLVQNGQWEVIVVHPHEPGIFAGLPRLTEISVAPIDPGKNYLRECYRYSKRVYAVVQRYPKAIVYSQGLSVWYKAGTLTNRLIVNPHGLEPYQALGTKDKLVAVPFKLVFDRLFKKAGKVVSLGGNLTRIIQGRVASHKIVVLPNGVMPREKQEKKPGARPARMLFVGRFAHNKGIHILMEAVKEINRLGYADQLEFHLVGKGPLYDHYQSNIPAPNVFLHGFVDDAQLEQMYQTYTAMVFPTLFEGMPTVILEAMACGMVVIASDTGAVAELVDAETGWLIERGSVSALTKALQQFLQTDAATLQKMSEAAVARVHQRFTWDRVAAAHTEVFEALYTQINNHSYTTGR